MAAFQKFDCFVQDLGRGVHNLNSDTIKVLFTNTAPIASNTVKSDLTEISAGNGYPAGGVVISLPAFAQTSGTAKLSAVASDAVITASGTVGPYRYAVAYNDTAAGKNLIGFWDKGSSRTMSSGDTETLDVSQASGILTVGP